MRSIQPEIVIDADSHEQYGRDLWRFRELLVFLTWRDVAVRYKQTAIGIAWALIRPLATVIAFTFVFGRIAKLSSDGAPYPLLVAMGMLPWQFFSSALSESSASLINNTSLVSKVYFPRLFLPASAVLTTLVEFGITLAFMLPALCLFGVRPDLRILTLPLFAAMALAAAVGAGLWLSALNARYRDFRYALPFVVQFGLYVSPVGFSSSEIPERWRLLYALNPMVGIIDGFRWASLGGDVPLHLPSLGLSLAISTLLLVTGFRFFRQMERTFADVI